LSLAAGRGSEIVKPVLRFRSVFFGPEHGFDEWFESAYKVKARGGAQVLAVWGPDRSKPPVEGVEGSRAIVISGDLRRRVAHIASDPETTSERHYLFEERLHKHNLWYLTYPFTTSMLGRQGPRGVRVESEGLDARIGPPFRPSHRASLQSSGPMVNSSTAERIVKFTNCRSPGCRGGLERGTSEADWRWSLALSP